MIFITSQQNMKNALFYEKKKIIPRHKKKKVIYINLNILMEIY